MLYLLGLSAIAVFGLFVYDIYKTQDKMQDQINRLSMKRRYPIGPISRGIKVDKIINDKDTPLVETGHLDPKHLPEGHPDKPKLCQYCTADNPVAEDELCMDCIAGDPGEHDVWYYYQIHS